MVTLYVCINILQIPKFSWLYHSNLEVQLIPKDSNIPTHSLSIVNIPPELQTHFECQIYSHAFCKARHFYINSVKIKHKNLADMNASL